MLRAMKTVSAGILALLSLAPAAPATAADLQLSPTTAWQVFYDNESCDLSRRFGEGDNGVTLFLQQFAPGDVFELRLVGAALGKPRSVNRAEIQFGTQEPVKLANPYLAATVDGNPALLAGLQSFAGWDEAAEKIRTITPSQEAAITTLAYKVPGKSRTVLATGPFDKVMQAMRMCTDNLVAHWGYDPAAVRALRSPPVPVGKPGRWIASSAYPSVQQQAGQEAILRVRMHVSAAGRAQNCTIQGRVGDPVFAKNACAALLKNARFEPACDADGKPVPAPWFTTVSFRMADPRWTF